MHIWVHSLPFVGQTKLQTRTQTSPVAEQSFGMYNNGIHPVVFDLCLTEKKEEKEKDEQNLVFRFGFSMLRKVGGTYEVGLDLAIK